MATVTRTYNIEGTREIVLEGWGEITLTQGNEELMVIETDDSIIDKLKTEVVNGRLALGVKSFLDMLFHFSFIQHKIHYQISVREIERLVIAGSGKVISGELRSGELKLKISGSGSFGIEKITADLVEATIAGSGDIYLNDMQTGQFKFRLPGSGKAYAAGSAPVLDASISGSGSLDALNLQSETAAVKINGSGHLKVNASKSLDAHISGSGKIEYLGQPAVRTGISGSGKIYAVKNTAVEAVK